MAGVRYFQCEAKRGVFSRLTRLTRSPLAGGDSTVSAISPAGSTSSLIKKPPLSDLRPGDRVIVMSSQGSKPGTLRFFGNTEFAPGDWCGVELDDPLGKNDGSVSGVR